MTSRHNQRGIGSGSQERVKIPANAEAPSAARAFLRDDLGGDFEPGRLHDLDLIVTELVTNAVQHGSNPGDGIELDLGRRRSTIYVAVTDPCRKRTSPTLLGFSSDRESGRGLMTVERLADHGVMRSSQANGASGRR